MDYFVIRGLCAIKVFGCGSLVMFSQCVWIGLECNCQITLEVLSSFKFRKGILAFSLVKWSSNEFCFGTEV